MRIGADVDIGMLPGHGDHFVGPGNAHMNAHQLELGKVAGHRVNADRTADTAPRIARVVNHGLTDLHLDRNVELDALGVKGVVARMVGRQLVPMRVRMGSNEAVFAHRVFKRAHAAHALSRVYTGQARKPIRVLLYRVGHQLIRHVVTGRVVLDADPSGDQEGALDARRVHAGEHALQADSVKGFFLDAHLVDIKAPAIGL